MHIYYHLSQYISHRIAGMEYIACLCSLGHTVIIEESSASSADMAILHDDPLNFSAIFRRVPELTSLHVIAFCVWENEQPPLEFIEPLNRVSQVWTPSKFSCSSLGKQHPDVHVLPHVVKRTMPSSEDLAFVRQYIMNGEEGQDQIPYYFLSIVDSINPRKNLKTLLSVYAAVRAVSSLKPLLVLKQYREKYDLSSLPGVISISGELTSGQIAALHILSGAYVSAHYAEGWGMGLSEAMAYGKPVIATAYSGNMEFMNHTNSLPVPYQMVPVSDEMCSRIPLFRPDMQWAQIDVKELVASMIKAVERKIAPDIPRNASKITKTYGPEQIAERLRILLTDFAATRGIPMDRKAK